MEAKLLEFLANLKVASVAFIVVVLFALLVAWVWLGLKKDE